MNFKTAENTMFHPVSLAVHWQKVIFAVEIAILRLDKLSLSVKPNMLSVDVRQS